MNRFLLFLREMKVELVEKPSWPTRDEVLNLTVVVVSSLVIVSVLLYLVDVLAAKSIQWAVVENVKMIKQFVNEFTFLIFIFFMVFVFYLSSKWSKR